MAGEDRQDLDAFVRYSSQEAFARLTGRYARMVYSACLSQLGSREDAEDAAQTAFLALARKARRRPDRVSSWPPFRLWLPAVPPRSRRPGPGHMSWLLRKECSR